MRGFVSCFRCLAPLRELASSPARWLQANHPRRPEGTGTLSGTPWTRTAPARATSRLGISNGGQLWSHTYSTNAAPHASGATESRGLGAFSLLALIFAVAAGSYAAGSIYPPALVKLAFPDPAPPRPDRASPEGQAQMDKIEEHLLRLPLTREIGLRASPAPPTQPTSPAQPVSVVQEGLMEAHYKASRPYARYPEERRRHSLTAGTLRGPGMVATPPLVFTKTEHGARVEGGAIGDAIAIMHLGRSVCGHDGVIHGGLIATIFDEALARTAFHALPSNVGVTARLEIDYCKPTMADQFVRVESFLVEAKGRKAVVRGQLKDMSGQVLAEAHAIFVEPRFAKFINRQIIQEFLN
ncbi:Thioesterase/thiol ester dehydrase-isomerase [Tilletiaria anomala UBC 951]|uniref:Thioesterase/thiol ester dehydrase-isomerase n=1 Tax=Tilletiaria anomala (strain ATCC 24038 / CBS 436.72 / UBC 951) TaxID=1037660 RepID=A0A066W6B9_TILAU|nr:Thioesterase/thiol ester dehydrase-isomerase [Tilletiaria anomala UBC 951]KDN46634.1 Thioesterase/thiol ester dehydrase-isomerase [Tilletiaria anomala UBC 951]